MTSGYIWLLATKNKNVFKVDSYENRYKQYPKKSMEMLSIAVNDHIAAEQKILKMLRAHEDIIQRKDLGDKYFEGEIGTIILTITSVTSMYLLKNACEILKEPFLIDYGFFGKSNSEKTHE